MLCFLLSTPVHLSQPTAHISSAEDFGAILQMFPVKNAECSGMIQWRDSEDLSFLRKETFAAVIDSSAEFIGNFFAT